VSAYDSEAISVQFVKMYLLGILLIAWMWIVFRKKRKPSTAVDMEQEATRVISDGQSEEDTQLKRRLVEFYKSRFSHDVQLAKLFFH